MRLFHGLRDDHELGEGFVSIGNFDGVHRGHAAIIKRLVARAGEAGLSAVVLTFDPHPIAILRPGEVPPSLGTLEDKAELLGACGVDAVVAWPTDQALLGLSPEEFFEQMICGRLAARGMVEGPNFRFGRDRSGDIDSLGAQCEAAGVSLEIVEPVSLEGRVISSSVVREAISGGDVAGAARLLGRSYRLQGTVVRGALRGRTLGFPTANLGGIATLLPADGVYAALARLDGSDHAAAVHVGGNPTFDEDERKIEVHLLDFDGDLYDRTLAVAFVDRIRGTVEFSGREALVRQLEQDVEAVRSRLASGDGEEG